MDNDYTLENIIKSESNLYDYLKSQLGILKISKKEKEICEYIIDCLIGFKELSDIIIRKVFVSIHYSVCLLSYALCSPGKSLKSPNSTELFKLLKTNLVAPHIGACP